MSIALPLCIVGLLLVTGVTGLVRPDVLYKFDTEDRVSGPPTPAGLRTVRISSLVMLLIACAMIYAILTSDGKPAEGPLF